MKKLTLIFPGSRRSYTHFRFSLFVLILVYVKIIDDSIPTVLNIKYSPLVQTFVDSAFCVV